jgi:hypothetical protein
MSTFQVSKNTANTVHEHTLKSAPARLLRFLQGMQNPAIRAKLAPVGLGDERLEEAWNLLHELRRTQSSPRVSKSNDARRAAATERCKQWLTGPVVRARAILSLSHPDVAEAFLSDLVPERGMNAVLHAATFLTRWDELEKTKSKESNAVFARLAEVSVTKAAVKALRADVEDARVSTDADAAILHNEAAQPEVSRVEGEALRQIYAWLAAWSEIARTVIVRRGELIRLGLAKRRATKHPAKVAPPSEEPGAVSPASPVPMKQRPQAFFVDGPPSSRAA